MSGLHRLLEAMEAAEAARAGSSNALTQVSVPPPEQKSTDSVHQIPRMLYSDTRICTSAHPGAWSHPPQHNVNFHVSGLSHEIVINPVTMTCANENDGLVLSTASDESVALVPSVKPGVQTQLPSLQRKDKEILAVQDQSEVTAPRAELVHAGSPAAGFACPSCGRVFSKRYNAQVHMRKHTQTRPFSCTICSKSFMWKSSLKSHKEAHAKQLSPTAVIVKASSPLSASLRDTPKRRQSVSKRLSKNPPSQSVDGSQVPGMLLS